MTRIGWIKLGSFMLVLAGIGWGLKTADVDLAQITPERIREWIVSFGMWAPMAYVVVYGQPIIPLPASVMTITGGLAFGPVWGTFAALFGATIRACTQFGVARLLGREAVAKLLKGKVATLDQKLSEHAFQAVLLIRLIPNLPFDVQNYGLGFSRVRFVPYAAASFLGMVPGSFAYVYLGYSLTDPTHVWKLGLAIVLIVGLLVAQRAWKSSRAKNTSTS